MKQTIRGANGRSELSPFSADPTKVGGCILDASHLDHRWGRGPSLGESIKAQPTTHTAIWAYGFTQELDAGLLQVSDWSLSLHFVLGAHREPEGNFKMVTIHRKKAQPRERHWQCQ